MIHLRFEGRSYELSPLALGLAPGSSAKVVKERIAQFLDVGIDRLDPYVVDQSPTGHTIVRPEAVYG